MNGSQSCRSSVTVVGEGVGLYLFLATKCSNYMDSLSSFFMGQNTYILVSEKTCTAYDCVHAFCAGYCNTSVSY